MYIWYFVCSWTQVPRNEGGIGKLNYPLVADPTHKISRDYNCLMEDAGLALRK
jgi:alkyl hydroperoxide reductase subunit AhpC